MGTSTTVNAYFLSLIAVLGTLLGAVTAGVFQYLGTKRQLRWQARESEFRRLAELDRWAHAAIEERQQSLWTERRRAYGALITAAEAWMEANDDIAATDLAARRDYRAHLRDVELLGHETIIPLAHDLHATLIRESRAAEDGERDGEIDREASERAKARLLGAMRHALARVHLPADPSAAIRRAPNVAPSPEAR